MGGCWQSTWNRLPMPQPHKPGNQSVTSLVTTIHQEKCVFLDLLLLSSQERIRCFTENICVLCLDVSTAQHSYPPSSSKTTRKKTQTGHRDSFPYHFRVKVAPLETGFSSYAQHLLWSQTASGSGLHHMLGSLSRSVYRYVNVFHMVAIC